MAIKRSYIVVSLLLSVFASAQNPMVELREKIEKAKTDTNKILLMAQYTNYLIESNQLDESLQWIDSSQRLSKKLNYQRGLAVGKYQLGNILREKNDFIKADSVYLEAIKEYTKVTYTKKRILGIIGVNNSRALLMKTMGMLDEAEKLDLENLDIALKLNDTNCIVTVYCNLMTSQLHYGKKKEAQQTAIAVERIATAYNNKRMLFMLYTNIGLMEEQFGNRKEAIEKYTKAIELGDKYEFDNSMVINNVSGLYEGAQRSKLLQLALFKAKKNNNNYTCALVMGNMGDINAKAGKLDDALRLYDSAMTYFEREKNAEGVSESYKNIGLTYSRKKDYNKALSNLLKGEEISIKHRLPKVELECKMALSLTYEKKGDFKNGLIYLQRYRKLNDSINNKDVEKQINALKTKNALENQRTELNAKAKAKQEKVQLKTEEDKKRQNLIIVSILVGLVMMSIFSFFIFRSLRQNRKANQIITLQKELVEKQKGIVEEKQKEILDSINYAKRIQYTLLANKELLDASLNDHFVYFKPKDIVSGDFYWAAKVENRFYVAVCDSTGHGVPGAFMSLLSIGFLNEAIKEKGIVEPNVIFNYVREHLIESISKEGQKDGFDGILLCMDTKKGKLTYAAANNAPILIKNGTLQELEKNRMPVGVGELKEDFKLFTIDMSKGDTLYLYTDGFADQFGGPRGKKFKYKQLNDLILQNSNASTSEQKNILEKEFESWKRDLEQVDDVCIIGIRI